MHIMFAAIPYAVLFFCSTSFDSGMAVAEAEAEVPMNKYIPAIFCFGDSNVDTGNNNFLSTVFKSNFPPYGRDFFASTPTGRFSNGKLIPDFIAERLEIQPFVPAYLDPQMRFVNFSKGTSFASAGTGLDPLTASLAAVLPTAAELKLFKDYTTRLRMSVGEEKAKYIINNGVYLVSLGNNDIGVTYFSTGLRRAQYDVPSYIAFLTDLASNFLKNLYALGARRIGVLSTSVLGCTPIARTLAGGITRGCVKDFNDAAELLNLKLSSEINYLNNNLEESRMVFLDIYGPSWDLIQNPRTYGFNVVDKGCCGSGIVEASFLCNRFSPCTCEDEDDSSYVHFDSVHFTERAYEAITSQILPKLMSSI